MRARHLLVGALAWLAAVAPARIAHAQGQRSSPIGGRTTLMGGAGIADGRDGAAPFLNPATVVRVGEGRITFSVNFYSLAIASAPSWFRPGPVDAARFGEVSGGDTAMSDVAFDVLPSSLCLFFKAGSRPRRDVPNDALGRDPRLAVCFATIEDRSFSYSEESRSVPGTRGLTRHAQTLSQRTTRFAVGPTYALHLTDALAVGASVHGSLATHRSSSSAAATTSVSGAPPIRSFLFASSRGTSAQVDAVLGATYRFGKQTVGVAVRSPSLHVLGSGGATRNVDFDGAGASKASVSADGDFAAPTPMRVGIGTALVDSWGSAEIDFSYHAPRRAYRAELRGHVVDAVSGAPAEREVAIDEAGETRGVVDANAGAEVHVTPTLSVLGGVGTELGVVARGALPSGLFQYFASRSDRVFGSLGVGTHGAGGELLCGVEVSYARGERLAVDSYALPPAFVPTPVDTTRILLVVAGSATLASIGRAVDDVTRALDPRKKPKP